MPRATIPDIAARAGVSTATVDRALNGRRGVSPANRQRVLEAAKDLGYLPTADMMPLPARPAHLVFLIPFGQNAFMRELSRAIADFAATLPLVASCRIETLSGIGPDALVPALDRLSLATSGVGVITTDHPRTREAIEQLAASGIRVVTIASDVPDSARAAYVGIENRMAGRTAAQLMAMLAGGRGGPVAVFEGSHAFHGHRERVEGFCALLPALVPALSLLPVIETGEDSARSRRAMASLLRRHPDLAGVYCAGAGRRGIIEAMQALPRQTRPAVIFHDLTDTARDWLARDRIDVVIDQNPRLVAEQAVIRLLGAIATTSPYLPLRAIEPRIYLRENLPPGDPPSP